jgi:hypothetical protein
MNGHKATILYASVKNTNGTLNVAIHDAGAYCLAFNHFFVSRRRSARENRPSGECAIILVFTGSFFKGLTQS